MKNIIIIFSFCLLNFDLFSQESLKIPTIELGLGVNHLTKFNDVDTKIGFGLSVKRIWFPEKKINLISGLIFEKTKYFDDYVQCGQYCNYRDMKFNIYSFSIPLMLRANIGKIYKIFLETGPAFEIVPFKYGKGIEVTYPPMSSIVENEISGDFEHDLTDFGVNVGLGFIFPVNNLKLIFGSTYHNSIKALTQKKHNEFSEYFTLRLGVLIN